MNLNVSEIRIDHFYNELHYIKQLHPKNQPPPSFTASPAPKNQHRPSPLLPLRWCISPRTQPSPLINAAGIITLVLRRHCHLCRLYGGVAIHKRRRKGELTKEISSDICITVQIELLHKLTVNSTS